MSWNILVTARSFMEAGEQAAGLLREAGCAIQRTPVPDPVREDDLLKLLPEYDAVLASVDQYSSKVLFAPEASRLKIISRWGVGYDSIDVSAATQNGIVIAFTPGLLDEAVADYTFALLLGIARRIYEVDASVRQGEWKLHWGHDIAGKNLGIIGYGRIGQAVARRASGFKMRVLAYDIVQRRGPPEVTFVDRLEELLSQADFVCLHAASTPESRGLIGEAQLRQMKPSACLINTARGPLVNEEALVRALKERWIAGAALDVFETEPLPLDNSLREAPHLLLSPHQASFGRETAERVSLAAAQAIVHLMNGKKPEYVVNPEVFNSGSLRATLEQTE